VGDAKGGRCIIESKMHTTVVWKFFSGAPIRREEEMTKGIIEGSLRRSEKSKFYLS